jgi:hypothetical protein
MASYTKATDFAAKDALLSGDPAKIIKGTEIDTEFNAISVAVSTKADTVSPTFTGTPLAPTAVAGTNTTQLATTAFVTAADVAERTATATLTSKTINLTSNTLTGTVAQFNTALSDGDFATIAGTETLTNKTLTSPVLTTPTVDVINEATSAAGVTVDGCLIKDGVAASATQLSTASGSAPSYSARAWVNFDGTGSVAIKEDGNVSSITDNGTGDYTVNFSTALPDANYAVSGFGVATSSGNITGGSLVTWYPTGTFVPLTKTTTAARILVGNPNSGSPTDVADISFIVFR